MQPKNGRAAERRRMLLQDLNRMSREATGLGVLLGEEIALRMGINHTDFECLDMISLRGLVTAGDIARASGLTTGAVTGVIDRLERAGYVRRERKAADRRKVYVSVVPGALKRGTAYYASLEAAATRLAESYSDKELALLVDFFTRSREIVLAEVEKLRGGAKGDAAGSKPA
jgi:DNA-binding MarR family transcriptional regulator